MYFKVVSPEVETAENPPAAAVEAEPAADETTWTPAEVHSLPLVR